MSLGSVLPHNLMLRIKHCVLMRVLVSWQVLEQIWYHYAHGSDSIIE